MPLQTQGTYAIDSKTYSIHFMDTDAVVKLERDPARDLYKNWQAARVRATRLQTDDGTTYDDFRVSLPDTTEQFPVGLWENPFTGEKLDRYGARVPSTTIGPDLLVRNLSIDGVFPALFHYYADHSLGTLTLRTPGKHDHGPLRAAECARPHEGVHGRRRARGAWGGTERGCEHPRGVRPFRPGQEPGRLGLR